MASKKTSEAPSGTLPFGAGAIDTPSGAAAASAPSEGTRRKRKTSRRRTSDDGEAKAPAEAEGKPARPRRKKSTTPPSDGAEGAGQARETQARETREPKTSDEGHGQQEPRQEGEGRSKRRRWQDRRRRRRNKRGEDGGAKEQGQDRKRPNKQRQGGQGGQGGKAPTEPAEGLLILERANHGHLRTAKNGWVAKRDDVHVAPRLVQKYQLREGSMLQGPIRRGQGRHKWDLVDVTLIDGQEPKAVKNLPAFKKLTSIDPDFHYALGDASGEVSLKVLDLICPVGRGQRGLIVAPPRSGKTILMQQFAKAVEETYPEVHLMVLLIDERPEEATEWQRSIQNGEVYVSTNDELHKRHVELAESVWKRCRRLVEMGEDVILLLDSITRLGRAYNNVHGNSGKTMSGGIDTRALERPKQFFGSARNTETAGSLTILGTTLIETGSRMDQVIFEEFKGTGNMELVLARRLADRRIFPAIDLERSGTRKEEKLISSRRLHLINTLRRVLNRMHWAEAMELLITKLDDVEKIDDFLQRFEVDPEA